MTNVFKRFFLVLTLSFFLYAPTFGATISRPMSNSGLVGYWNFEEGAPNGFANDRSGFGNNGTLVNMNTTTSWTGSATSSGQALDFDSNDDYIDVGSGSNLDNLGPMTVSAWYYARSEGENSRGGIFNKGDGDGVGTNGPEFEFGSTGFDGSDRTNAFAFGVGFSGGALHRIASNNTVTLNKWQFVTLTWDGTTSSSGVHIYIDGVEVSYQKSQDGIGSLNDDSGTNMSIGIGSFGAQSNSWDGKLDEVRIYNRALSFDEVQRLYKIQKPRVVGGVTNRGLSAYWAFEENTGTRAEDSSLNNNTGTLTSGPTWVSGKNGKALFFDGVDDYVSIPNASAVAPPNAITISAWVKATTTTATQSIIDDDNGGSIGYFLRITSSGKLNGRITATTITGNTTLQPNTWYHVALIYDGANVYVYLNGISDATPVARTGTITYSGASKAIGKRPAGGAQFNGTIDEFRMYDRGLSASEVYALYKGSVATVVNKSKTNRLTNGLVGYWTFDGNKIAGVTAYDSGSGGNNGAITNGPMPGIGMVGQGLSFDGVDDCVIIANSASIQNLGPMTVSFWSKFSTTTAAGIPVGKRDGSNTGAWFIAFSGSSRNINFTKRLGVTRATSNSTLLLYEWAHIVVTWDGSNNGSGINIYQNGTELSYQTTVNGTAADDSTNNLGIGAGLSSGACSSAISPFAGLIDDVRLYNRVITQDEIKALYNMGR